MVDIVRTLPGYSPRRFPLTEAFELPFVCGDAEATSQALHEFYRTWLQGEYDDTYPLVFHSAAPGHIHTADREVRTLKDLEGLKIRLKAARAFLAESPYGRADVFAETQFRPWDWRTGRPG